MKNVIEPFHLGAPNAPPRPLKRPPLITRTHRPPPEATWWLHNRRYLFYMVREFTAIPIAAWVIVFMVEVARLQSGRAGYQPLSGPIWIAFSAVCLVFALWHSFTFLSLAGRIIRVPKREGYLHPRLIVGAMFSLLVVASIVIGSLLVMGGSAT